LISSPGHACWGFTLWCIHGPGVRQPSSITGRTSGRWWPVDRSFGWQRPWRGECLKPHILISVQQCVLESRCESRSESLLLEAHSMWLPWAAGRLDGPCWTVHCSARAAEAQPEPPARRHPLAESPSSPVVGLQHKLSDRLSVQQGRPSIRLLQRKRQVSG
jgi:hypothetical protein